MESTPKNFKYLWLDFIPDVEQQTVIERLFSLRDSESSVREAIRCQRL
jgi:hypothetical protein